MIKAAKELVYADLLGANWKADGQSIEEGFNCWSLAKEVHRRLGLDLPDYRHLEEQIMIGGKFQYARVDTMIRDRKYLFKCLERPEPFCLVTFILRPPYVTHIGVVLGDGRRFIHILKQSSVSVERLDSLLWINKIDGFWKYFRGRENIDKIS